MRTSLSFFFFFIMAYWSRRGRCQDFGPRSVNSFVSAGSTTNSGVAHSVATGPDGVTRGECAYIDAQGRQAKVRYEEDQSGIKIVSSSPFVEDPGEAIRQCRRQTKLNTQQAFDQQRVFQEQLHRQTNEMLQQQQDILRSFLPMNNFAPQLPQIPNLFPGGFNNFAQIQF